MKPLERWALTAILLIAALLRLWDIGFYRLNLDESLILHHARAIALDGQWTWVGNPTSSNTPLEYHSPLTFYLNAMLYAVYPSPVAARVIVALLNVGAVAALYWAGRRWHSPSAGLYAALCLAIHPYAVHFSRFVWNPNYALLPLAVWLFSAVPAYLETSPKRWAIWLHWVMLGLAVQAQASYAVFVPLSLLLMGYRLWNAQRGVWLRQTLQAWAISGVMAAAWLIGLSQVWLAGRAETSTDEARYIQPLDLRHYLRRFADLLTGYDWLGGNFPYPYAPDAGENLPLTAALPVPLLGILAYGLAAALLIWCGWAVWQDVRAKRLYHSFLALVMVYPLGLLIYDDPLKRNMRPDFFMLTIIGGALLTGIVLAQLRPHRFPIAYWLSPLVLWGALHAWQPINNASVWVASLNTFVAIRQTWQAEGIPALIIAPPDASAQLILWDWRAARATLDLNVMRLESSGLPIYPDSTLIGLPAGTDFPPAWAQAMALDRWQTIGRLSDGRPMYRWQVVTAGMLPVPTVIPPPITYTDGATWHGMLWQGDQLHLLWQTGERPPAAQDKFSVRLIHAADGTRYAQWDGIALGLPLWKPHTQVLNTATLALPSDLPPDTPLMLEVIRYDEFTWQAIPFTGADGSNATELRIS
ncbi:MAG: ArnT family glycosyltransferase, partial [Phototrophicaceae bacterium]